MDDQLPFPPLRVSARINRPVLVGLFRTFILIPPAYNEEGFDKESLKLILLHELAHAAQGDTYFHAAASLAQSLWFFLPFLWWLRTQLRIDQEFLADQRVVMLTGSPAGYATRLVTLATARKVPSSARTTDESPVVTIREAGRRRLHSPAATASLDVTALPVPARAKTPALVGPVSASVCCGARHPERFR